MIRRLRIRLTILVVVVLVLVSGGIIFSINYLNWRNIRLEAENALDTLVSNSGSRPSLKKETPPEGILANGVSSVSRHNAQTEDIVSEDTLVGDLAATNSIRPMNNPTSAQEQDPGIIEEENQIAGGERKTPGSGEGPGAGEDPGTGKESERFDKDPHRSESRGQPLDTEDMLASLSNYYAVTLSSQDERVTA